MKNEYEQNLEQALADMSQGLIDGNNTCHRVSAFRSYDNIDTGVDARTPYTRKDYEYFRPNDAIPKRQKEIIAMCMRAARRVGIVRNTVDLMSDFASQGIHLAHSSPRVQKWYQMWFQKVHGPEKSERFLSMLYRAGNVIIQRQTIQISRTERVKLLQTFDKEDVDPDFTENSAPIKYYILNPLTVDVNNAQFGKLTDTLEYVVNLDSSLYDYDNADCREYMSLLNVSDNIRKFLNAKNRTFKLDPDKTYMSFYKKDDWQIWADPMIYAILDDLILYEKAKLSDLTAFDGIMSKIRIFRLGNLDKGIIPKKAIIEALARKLKSNAAGGSIDLVWGPDIELIESKVDQYNALGEEKYKPIIAAIHAGLGIPSTLTGQTGSGLTNNYIALQTLIKRLKYGRMKLLDFWNHEIKIFQRVMGFREPATVRFDYMDIGDEASMLRLWIELADRNLISWETVLERFGEDILTETGRLKREEKMRQKNNIYSKTGPWNVPESEKEFSYKKIFAQNKEVTPSELGIELKDRKPGEETGRDILLKKIKQSNKDIKGISGQGRPPGSGDKNKRKRRMPKPSYARIKQLDKILKQPYGRSITQEQLLIIKDLELHILAEVDDLSIDNVLNYLAGCNIEYDGKFDNMNIKEINNYIIATLRGDNDANL